MTEQLTHTYTLYIILYIIRYNWLYTIGTVLNYANQADNVGYSARKLSWDLKYLFYASIFFNFSL